MTPDQKTTYRLEYTLVRNLEQEEYHYLFSISKLVFANRNMSESFSDSVNTSGTTFSSKSSKETIKGDSLPIRSVTFTNNLNFLEEKLDIKFWLSPMPPPKIRLKTSAEKKIVQNFIHFNSSGEIF